MHSCLTISFESLYIAWLLIVKSSVNQRNNPLPTKQTRPSNSRLLEANFRANSNIQQSVSYSNARPPPGQHFWSLQANHRHHTPAYTTQPSKVLAAFPAARARFPRGALTPLCALHRQSERERNFHNRAELFPARARASSTGHARHVAR